MESGGTAVRRRLVLNGSCHCRTNRGRDESDERIAEVYLNLKGRKESFLKKESSRSIRWGYLAEKFTIPINPEER